MKENVLIVFSNKGELFAELLQTELEGISYTILENQVLGLPMQNKFDKLIKQLKQSDYGIAVITEDYTEDNNIMFLIGLFIGHLGIERFSLVMPNSIKNTVICDYLKGFEPICFDSGHPNQSAAIAQAITTIKHVLPALGKRKKQEDFIVLENKKELLRIALSSCGRIEGRYNAFLAHLIKVFQSDYLYIQSEVVGATLFELREDFLIQISTAGIVGSNHKFSIVENDKYVVQCLKQEDELILGEKIGRYLGGETYYEYIFCKCMHKRYVLTVHIKYNRKIVENIYEKYLKSLMSNNAGYISVLELFLKGGMICAETREKKDTTIE